VPSTTLCCLPGLERNEPHMPRHKFKVGQSVRFTPGKLTPPAGAQAYTIVRALPAEGGEYPTMLGERKLQCSALSQRKQGEHRDYPYCT
jgi:hypothetical protein